MYKILKKKQLAPAIYLMEVEAPRVAHAAQPGQFLIVIVDEKGERIPLTICDYDAGKGTVTIVIQAIGALPILWAHWDTLRNLSTTAPRNWPQRVFSS